MVFVETPANPALSLVDLDAIGAIAGPITVVDSTFAGPAVQRPLDHGVDLVLHAATKGIAGHNDSLLGVVAGNADLIEPIWAFQSALGTQASPFDAWNGVRGIRTLPVRSRQQSATALALAPRARGAPADPLGVVPVPREPPAARPGRAADDAAAAPSSPSRWTAAPTTRSR